MIRRRPLAFAYPAIAGLLILLAYPVLAWLVRTWLTNPYYTHGFAVPAIAALLAWRQWRTVAAEPRRGSTWAGAAVTLAGLGVFLASQRWQDYVVASLALVVLLIGILLFLEGWARVRHWLFPLLFLALMVPLPFIDRASPWLESFTARWATALVRLVGVDAVQQGGEITLPGSVVRVGAPCSGLRSLVVMVTVGVAWVYLVQGRTWAKAAMLASILPLVALSNVLRIAVLLAIAHRFGVDAAMSYYHDWSSPVLFLLALALFLLVGKLLRCNQLREDLF